MDIHTSWHRSIWRDLKYSSNYSGSYSIWMSRQQTKRSVHFTAFQGISDISMKTIIFYCKVSQIVISGPSARTSPGNMLNMQILLLQPRSTESEILGQRPNNLLFHKHTRRYKFLRTTALMDSWSLIEDSYF